MTKAVTFGDMKITFMRDIMRDIMYSGSQSPQNVATIIHWAYEVLEVTTRREICKNDDFQATSTKNDPKWPKVVTFGDIKIAFMRDIMRDIMYSGSQTSSIGRTKCWEWLQGEKYAKISKITPNPHFGTVCAIGLELSCRGQKVI